MKLPIPAALASKRLWAHIAAMVGAALVGAATHSGALGETAQQLICAALGGC